MKIRSYYAVFMLGTQWGEKIPSCVLGMSVAFTPTILRIFHSTSLLLFLAEVTSCRISVCRINDLIITIFINFSHKCTEKVMLDFLGGYFLFPLLYTYLTFNVIQLLLQSCQMSYDLKKKKKMLGLAEH